MRKRHSTNTLAAIAAVAALSACGGASFAEKDPEGYKTCSMYAEVAASTSTVTKIGGLFEVGEQARKAGTKAIRDAAQPLFDQDALEASGQENDFPMVDSDRLEDACSDAGFEF